MKPKKILILGGGTGGLRAAILLSRQIHRFTDYEIVLVDKLANHILNSSLYEIPVLGVRQNTVGFSIRSSINKLPIRFCQDIVTRIDPVRHSVTLSKQGSIHYEYLIIALGSSSNMAMIPGLADYAYPFTNMAQALALRQELTHAVKTGKPIRLIIGGAGLSGCELAGELAAAYKPKTGQLKIDLIEAASHILSGFVRSLSRSAETRIRALGIDLYTGRPIKRVTAKFVVLADDHKIPYDILIWTGGIKAAPVLQTGQFELDHMGRIIVSRNLQARGYSRVYAVGDAASFSSSPKHQLGQTAPTALAEGQQAAQNIIRQLSGGTATAYHPRSLPTLLTIGPDYGFLLWGPWLWQSRWLPKLRHWIEASYLGHFIGYIRAWHKRF